MTETIYRQWMILMMIPRFPNKIGTRDIMNRLQSQGVEVTQRTIQRDLLKLSENFPLVSDDNKPMGWSFTQDAPHMDIPNMDRHTALTFHLVGEFLGSMLPPATLRHLQPYFKRAEEVLSSESAATLKRWPEKIRVLPRWQTLTPPEIKHEVVEAIYQAVLNQRQVKICYRKRGEKKTTKYTASPVGLVFRDSFIYLICRLYQYENVVQLVLHRMQKVEVLDEPARVKGFDLDDYINKGEMGFALGKEPLELKALFDHESAELLHEVSLVPKQKLEPVGDKVMLTATVPDTVLLRAWLLSYGEKVQVVGPKELVEWFRKTTGEMKRAYIEEAPRT